MNTFSNDGQRPAANYSRRRFIKRTGILASAYFLGAFTLTSSRPAQAVIPLPTEFVRLFIQKSKEWYDETGKDLIDMVKEFVDSFKISNYFSALVTATDAANVIKNTVHKRHQKRLTQPNPSDGCAAEAATTAADATEEALYTTLKYEAWRSASEFIENLPDNDPSMSQAYERALTDSLEEYPSIQSLLEALDARDFAGPHGYIDGESGDMDLYRRISTARARRAILDTGGSTNNRTLATAITAYTRVTVVENALDFLYSRRIRSTEAFNQASGNSDEYEEDILNDLAVKIGDAGEPGVAVVDLEYFETRRTHLSDTWQELVSENTSSSSLSKELALMMTHQNALDTRIYEIRQRLNDLASVKVLSVLDSPGMPNRSNSTSTEEEEEEILLRR